MKPKIAKGWACGQCRKLYPHNATGKKMAAACCLCRECGGTGTAYTGTINAVCYDCLHRQDVTQTTESFEKTQDRLVALVAKIKQRTTLPVNLAKALREAEIALSRTPKISITPYRKSS